MKFSLLHPADQLITMMDRIYRNALTTTSGGNLSVMDEQGDIWITPSSIDKGTLTRRDIIQVKPDGTCIGPHVPSVELPFHAHIYQLCPDVRAVVHTHSPALVAFSLARKSPDTRLLADVFARCGQPPMTLYEVPGSTALGDRISAAFEQGARSVMLENHGVVCGGRDLAEAFMRFEALEYAARMEMEAYRLGTPRPLAQPCPPSPSQMPSFTPEVHTTQEKQARRDLIAFIHRCVRQHLFSSTQGAYSQRLGEREMLITPHGMDRAYLEPEDLVLVRDGRAEAGKTPSVHAAQHAAIYAAKPAVNAVVSAHPPYISAFAVTEAVFDSRTIPESYIQLRTTARAPYGTPVEQVAAQISGRVPMVMVENQGIVVTGKSLVNAFDRLEVADVSARAIIEANTVGALITMNAAQTTQIEEVFHLNEA
ncbi:MAG: class II aldolase/adducin family protein [Christensenellales bacterium]